jgi:hypothetical protein
MYLSTDHIHIPSSGMLHVVDWWLFTDVSGQHIGPIFKTQVVHDSLTLEEMGFISCPETSVILRNISEVRSYYLHLGGSVKSRTMQD